MAGAVADGVFPGAVLLWASRNQVLYHKAFGVTDLRFGEPVTLNTVFDLASLTKPLVTALAVADLIASGLLSQNTYLEDALPDACGTDKAKITIDMLLRHRSGLPAHSPYFKMLDAPVPSIAAREHLRQLVLAQPWPIRLEPRKFTAIWGLFFWPGWWSICPVPGWIHLFMKRCFCRYVSMICSLIHFALVL